MRVTITTSPPFKSRFHVIPNKMDGCTGKTVCAGLGPNTLSNPSRNFVRERFDLVAVGAFDEETGLGFRAGITKQDAALAVELALDFFDELHYVGQRVPLGFVF